MSDDLTALRCPACNAAIEGLGTCGYCGAEVRHADAVAAGQVADAPAAGPPAWVEEARELDRAGRKIHAIKHVRENRRIGLKEAKEFVENDLHDDARVTAFLAQNPESTGPSGGGSSGGSSCFPASALVETPSGPRPIGEIRRGAEVWAWSPERRCRVVARVTARREHPPQELWRIAFGDGGAPLVTTGNHTLLTCLGWQRADRIRPGDRLPSSGGELGRLVVHSEATGHREPVFNLHTTGPHTFVVEGVVAHNFTVLREIRALWHRLSVDPWIRTTPEREADLPQPVFP